jgi:DNA-binding GntR family transcriptional regulator
MDLRSITDKVYEQLRLDILAGRRQQGQRIDLGEVARTYGISPQPVREAIIRLTNEGLVQVLPRRGTFVTEVTADDVVHINQAREMLETYAIRQHGPLTAEDLRPLEEALADMDRVVALPAYDYLEYNLRDFEFHCRIVDLAGNPRIVDMYRWLRPHFTYAMVMYRTVREVFNHGDHRRILDALAAGDIEEAVRQTERHIRGATDMLLTFMRETAHQSVKSSSL